MNKKGVADKKGANVVNARTTGDKKGAKAADADKVSCGKQACVRHTPLACVGSSVGSSVGSTSVGKVYASSALAKRELAALVVMRKVDPAGTHHAVLRGVCDVAGGKTQLFLKPARFTLRQLVGHVPPTNAVDYRILIQGLLNVMRGLALFNAAGFVHNDITPDNIMVTDANEMILIDFGYALPLGKVFDRKSNLFLNGTWPYNPPEFKLFLKLPLSDVEKNYAGFRLGRAVPLAKDFDARRAAAKADVFAFGVLMLWCADAVADAAFGALLRATGLRLADMDLATRPTPLAAAAVLSDAAKRWDGTSRLQTTA
jgi:hypothetical protein